MTSHLPCNLIRPALCLPRLGDIFFRGSRRDVVTWALVCVAGGFDAEPTDSADEAYRRVVADGGATKPVRESITTYVAETVRDGTGCIPASAAVWPGGGFAHFPPAKAPDDKNQNGIPDEWEARRGLKPAASAANGHELDPHYDNVEVI